MSISTVKSVLFGAALAAGLPCAAAHAQVNSEPDAMDVARTPLEDLNIDAEDLPDILVKAAGNPYSVEGLAACNDLVTEIAVLDNTLGPDFDLPQEERDRISAGRIGKSLVGSLLPFRSILREVTGAAKRKDEYEAAVTAGLVRRAFLKGVGLGRGCAYPARPRDMANVPAPNPEVELEQTGGE
ncbi:hypothetical protein INR77_10885 [Erythrobacter sp. SCSIO 43205]|uniref:hypothetical protein n=1 Tax=Erythrobacter sp. SCSIO 43205 TaxID=2779361 RepID=UPI001CA7C8C0|nr:hypothetical protein [Erythrobacter sp. SCSIO 43205]UAB77313.1 hypothetical protein INR77_10885 [Erythrobacter sp. SCSIO 43205]